jgi:hypothetical protein
MADTNEPPQDVVVYEIASRRVDHIAGHSLTDKGHYTIEKRLETVSLRLGSGYNCCAVPAGKYKPGDILPDPL